MTRELAFGTGIAMFITAAWGIHPGAQAPIQAQSQAARPQVATVDPCAGRTNTVECLSYRIDRVDRQLIQMEASVSDLQARAARAVLPGPPISQPLDPGGMADANSAYLQQRIDAIARTVTDLVNRANAVR